MEIDRINKPRLPLASSELSMAAGQFLVSAMGITALIGAWLAGPLLLLTVLTILLIGAAYSVPRLRLKRSSLWAGLSIALARSDRQRRRGAALQPGLRLAGFSPFTLAVLGAFFFAFGIVIAIYKDILDLMGDRLYGIQTLTVRFGPRSAFQAGRLMLTLGYLGLMLVAVSRLPRPEAWWMLAAQLGLLIAFWLVSSRVDPSQRSSFARFRLFLWGLFYSQYVVMSFYRLGGGVE